MLIAEFLSTLNPAFIYIDVRCDTGMLSAALFDHRRICIKKRKEIPDLLQQSRANDAYEEPVILFYVACVEK